MKKFAFILIIFFLAFGRAAAFEVKGKVLTSEGKSISGAIVIHPPSGKQTQTDDQGVFTLDIPQLQEGRFKLHIVHPDYMEEVVSFNAKSLPKQVNVVLSAYIRQREEVVVTAMRYPEPSAKVPAAATVVSSEAFKEKMSANITAGLSSLPGVFPLGSGGFSLVPSIRGLARNRILLMIDNARVVSDRRTGPSASFVSPGDIERIEVLRSPSSVLYGSDAMGGVVNIFTKKPNPEERFKGKLDMKYGTVNREKAAGLSLQGGMGKTHGYLSVQGIDAENYSSPLGEVFQSRFSQTTWMGKAIHQTEKREIELSFLGARGINIGKPNRSSRTSPTWYPKENHNLVQLAWREKKIWGDGELTAHFYLNPNFLETLSEKVDGYKSKESYSKTKSTDYGFQVSFGKSIIPNLRLSAGTDFFGRSGVEARNFDKNFDVQGKVTKTFEEFPYTQGQRKDLGLFVSFDYDGIQALDLVGGVRWDYLQQRANPGGGTITLKNIQNAFTGFLAASAKITEKVVLFANLARAYRAPNLGERFYTGITGRGFIIAKPDLKSETSLNTDMGIKWISRRLFAALYAFSYTIDDLIERYLISERTYTYGNVDKGRIQGIEAEAEYVPFSGLSIFGNLTSLRGTSVKTGLSLNDVPPLRLYLGMRAWAGRFSFEINGTIQDRKDKPGPAEIIIPSAEFFDLRASYLINKSLRLTFLCSNLFNKAYVGRPDPEAMEEPGRNFVFGIGYSF